MTTKAYNSIDHALYVTTHDDVTFVFQGKPDGDYVTAVFDSDSASGVEGADGDVQFSQRVAEMGTITATNQWGSVSNENMNYCFRMQKKGNYLKRVELKRISESENVSIFSTGRPMITKAPDYGIGTTANDRAWGFKVEKLKFAEETAPA